LAPNIHELVLYISEVWHSAVIPILVGDNFILVN